MYQDYYYNYIYINLNFKYDILKILFICKYIYFLIYKNLVIYVKKMSKDEKILELKILQRIKVRRIIKYILNKIKLKVFKFEM